MSSYPIQQSVGRQGATITGPDGLKLILPAMSWPDVVDVEIAGPLFKVDYLPGIVPVSYTYIIYPQGHSMAVRGTIYLPFYGSWEGDRSNLRVYRSNDAGGIDPDLWEPLPVMDNGDPGILGGTFLYLGAFFIGRKYT